MHAINFQNEKHVSIETGKHIVLPSLPSKRLTFHNITKWVQTNITKGIDHVNDMFGKAA